MIGSTNGSSRGQLRPYLSGRTPPFILLGLLVILGILGFSYHSLNTQYKDLLTEIEKLEERLRVYAEKRESVEKMNSALQAEMQIHKDLNKKFKITMYKKDQELNTLSDQLRDREEEVNKANLQIQSLKSDMEKLDSRDKQKENEITSLQDQAKSLKIENQELADMKAGIMRKFELLQKKAGSLGFKAVGESNNALLSDQDKGDIPSSSPDVGMPPQSKEYKYHPILPVMANHVREEPKVQTVPAENPDISNTGKSPDVTSNFKFNEVAGSQNEPDPQAIENHNSV